MSLLILLSNMFSLMLDGEADLFLGSNGSDAFFGKKRWMMPGISRISWLVYVSVGYELCNGINYLCNGNIYIYIDIVIIY